MNLIEKPIVVEQVLMASTSEIWEATSEFDYMRQWFFEGLKVFNAEVGFETQFNVKSGKRNFLHLWKLIEVIPRKKIVFLWKYGEYTGESFVSFELFEEGAQTRLQVSHTGIESFSKSIPEFTRKSCQEGWQYFICDRLIAFMEKKRS